MKKKKVSDYMTSKDSQLVQVMVPKETIEKCREKLKKLDRKPIISKLIIAGLNSFLDE